MSDLLELEISDLSRGGAGVARAPDGRVIFVPRTLPGDRVQVRVLEDSRKTKKHYAQAELVEVVAPATQRVTPRCPVFGKCGGCEWQHVPYEIQWTTKRAGVLHALQRAFQGRELPSLGSEAKLDEFPARDPWGYRNRIQLRGLRGKGQQVQLGFFAPGTRELVPIDRCEIARPELNAELERVRADALNEPRVRNDDFKVELEVLPDGATRKVWNAAHGALGFRQVNDEQNERLRDWVAGTLAPALGPEVAILDLFGGSGNLSLPLLDQVGRIDCVDVTAPESQSADKLRYHRSGVLPWLVRATKRNDARWDLAILDPPREGLGADFAGIESALSRAGVKELIAIGCDPDSWARDLSRFASKGWRVVRLAAFDLFPQTHHVEAAAHLVHGAR